MYDSSQLFSSFIKHGQQTDYDKNTATYVYQLAEDMTECKDFEHLGTALKDINRSSCLTVVDGGGELEFEDGSQYWEEGFKAYFYRDIDRFIRNSIKSRDVPDKFCIVDKKFSEADINNPVLRRVLHVTRWTKLLAEMADHVQQDKNIFVFFVHHKEGKTKPYEISPLIDFGGVEALELDCDDTKFEHLSGSWSLEDAHTKDRQSVMLVSFAEIMSSLKDGENPFEKFLANTKKFHDRYCENYDIYVNRFSVDNQLREIDEQHLSFVGKLQDLVTSSQTKAFALPGVMVAIGALSKVSNGLGIFAIVVGVIMTKVLISKSNELLRENIEHFKNTFDRALGHYVKSRTEAEEVKSHAKQAQEELNEQLDKALQRVDFIDRMSKWMLWLSLVFALIMFVSLFKEDQLQEAVAFFEWAEGVSKSAYHWIKENFIRKNT